MQHAELASPIGPLLLTSRDGRRLSGLYPAGHVRRPVEAGPRTDPAGPPFAAATEQLAEYFAGRRRVFELDLDLAGTPFQRQVWSQLQRIGYGTTVSYRDLAAAIGRPTAARAVGLANGRNPISIIVPCHRLIGSTGDLTGYAGGLATKQWLLDHESATRRAQDTVTARQPTRGLPEPVPMLSANTQTVWAPRGTATVPWKPWLGPSRSAAPRPHADPGRQGAHPPSVGEDLHGQPARRPVRVEGPAADLHATGRHRGGGVQPTERVVRDDRGVVGEHGGHRCRAHPDRDDRAPARIEPAHHLVQRGRRAGTRSRRSAGRW